MRPNVWGVLRPMASSKRVRIFVETESGSNVRRVYDETTHELLSTRRVVSPYPFPYGFILGTTTEDGSAVDCYVLTAKPIRSGSVVEGEPVGLVEQFEDGEVDHKVLAILPGDAPRIDADLHETLLSFTDALFRPFPSVRVEVGRILGAHEARVFITSHRAAGLGGGGST